MEICHHCSVSRLPTQRRQHVLLSSRKRRLQATARHVPGQACSSRQSATSPEHCNSPQKRSHLLERLKQPAAAVLAACAACWLAQAEPVLAELQTVPLSTATNIAKPLKTQSFNKNKIWLLFGAGAAGILGTAILLEQNERFFPAIAKANEAMRAAQRLRESQPAEESPNEDVIDTSASEPEAASQSAFAAGLKEASQKAKAQSTPSATADVTSQPQPDASADSSNNSRAELSHSTQEAQQDQQSQQSSKQLQPKG